ncbi:MAG: M48 family metalloprotease [Planctomycetota bacterium]
MRKMLLTILAGVVLLACGGCGSLANSGRLLSTSDEITVGSRIQPEFERLLGGKVKDEAVQRYVQRVGQRIASVAGRRLPYEFAVLRPDVPNYFVLPGGKIYLTKGLLAMLEDERQLAGVLANAVGHACHRQPVKAIFKRMKTGMYLAVAKLAIEDPDESGYRTAIRLARELILSEATRRDEMQADALAVQYLARADYSPWGLAHAQRMLYQRCIDQPKKMTKLYQSHPLTFRRMKLTKVAVEIDYAYYDRSRPSPTQDDYAAVRRSFLGDDDRVATDTHEPAPQPVLAENAN